jgi:hypothetical protein
MKPLKLNVSTLTLLIVWIASFTAALTLIFMLYAVAKSQPLVFTHQSSCSTAQKFEPTNQETNTSLTRPSEPEIKNDADMQNTLDELEKVDIDQIDNLLDQNDLDATGL